MSFVTHWDLHGYMHNNVFRDSLILVWLRHNNVFRDSLRLVWLYAQQCLSWLFETCMAICTTMSFVKHWDLCGLGTTMSFVTHWDFFSLGTTMFFVIHWDLCGLGTTKFFVIHSDLCDLYTTMSFVTHWDLHGYMHNNEMPNNVFRDSLRLVWLYAQQCLSWLIETCVT
jgi:hypothetical protein